LFTIKVGRRDGTAPVGRERVDIEVVLRVGDACPCPPC
jgi:hypothetical protein